MCCKENKEIYFVAGLCQTYVTCVRITHFVELFTFKVKLVPKYIFISQVYCFI